MGGFNIIHLFRTGMMQLWWVLPEMHSAHAMQRHALRQWVVGGRLYELVVGLLLWGSDIPKAVFSRGDDVVAQPQASVGGVV